MFFNTLPDQQQIMLAGDCARKKEYLNALQDEADGHRGEGLAARWFHLSDTSLLSKGLRSPAPRILERIRICP